MDFVKGVSHICSDTAPEGTNRVKWERHKVASLSIAAKMREAGFEIERVDRIMHCGDYIIFDRCADCGTYHIEKTSLCRDRLCPLCSWRLALKRYAEVSRLMGAITTAYPDAYYSFVTLTVRNCALSELRQTLDKMQRAWNRLRQRKDYKVYCMGSARSIEITRNDNDGTYHPHYHLITMWRGDRDKSAPAMAAALVRNWIDCVGQDGLVVSAAAQCAETVMDAGDEGRTIISAVVETYKYAIKPKDLTDIPVSELRAFAAQIANVRFVSFAGIIKDYAAKCAVDVDTVDDTCDDTIICERCRSQNIDRIIYKWSFGERRYILSSPDCDYAAQRAEAYDNYRAQMAQLDAIYAKGDK